MKIETPADMAKIIEAEASVLDWSGKVAVAQCIRDRGYESEGFTKSADTYSAASLEAAHAVMYEGLSRYPDADILFFRSFARYAKGTSCEPNFYRIYEKTYWPVPSDCLYLGEDHVATKWGHFYFGRYHKMMNFKLLVMAGHGENVDGSWDPGAIGCNQQEANLTRELTKLIKVAADKVGLPTDIAPDRNHYSFFKNGGQYDVTGYNYVLEIHFNASSTKTEVPDRNMKGTMVYIDQSETGHSVEDKILRKLYELGSKQAWDGVVITQRQYENGLMVQNHIRSQGVSHCVLETCFITDADDVAWYHAKKEKIAEKIVEGIIEGFGLNQLDPNNYTYCGKGIATAESLETMNVRDASAMTGVVIGLVKPGERVEVLEKLKSGWLKIVWPGTNCGFAYVSNVNGMYFKFIN